MAKICERFGLSMTSPSEVKIADEAMLATEMEQVMAPPPATWQLRQVALEGVVIEGWHPSVAEQRFLARFHSLTTK